MSWFLRGVQSAIFHYASCAPCTGYMYRKKRRKQGQKDKEAREKLHLEQPDLYRHPGPTDTNPFWTEEIVMGPGPPARRSKRTNTGTTSSQRGITTAGTQSTSVSQAGSSLDMDHDHRNLRLSEDTLDDDNWNRKRYQREDEDLWGLSPSSSPTGPRLHRGLSFSVSGITRTGTNKSSAESYYTARAPPVNDLHPPIVSNPSSRPSENHWMLQPPPKASIMSGKERATRRSRSGSGASSRVELSLQRQVSARQLKIKIERGETPEVPTLSRGNSYNDLVAAQRHDRPTTPHVRPISAASSRRKKKRRDTALSHTVEAERSSGDSSDTLRYQQNGEKQHPAAIGVVRTPTYGFDRLLSPSSPTLSEPAPLSPTLSTVPSLNIVRVRNSRPRLSTVFSSDSLSPQGTEPLLELSTENKPSRRRPKYSSTQSSESIPYLMKHRSPLIPTDESSLNVLQDLVSPRALLDSRFVSAPLTEARIKLPPSDADEDKALGSRSEWPGSGFGISRGWGTDIPKGPVPFDSGSTSGRDPRMRWSVDF